MIFTEINFMFYCLHVHISVGVCICTHRCVLGVEMGLICPFHWYQMRSLEIFMLEKANKPLFLVLDIMSEK